jgi:hypothetical protein
MSINENENEILSELETAIQIWKEKNIVKGNMEFSCGGDSMNEYNFTFEDKDGNEVDSPELTDYFDNEVFNRVQFYEASDGYYLGESGDVVITLEDDEESFEYYKSAQSEFSESFTEQCEITLTEQELKFIKEKVSSIVGTGDDDTIFNYKSDFILTDEEEDLIEELSKKINDECGDYDFQEAEGDCNDNYTFSSNRSEDEEQLLFSEDNKLIMNVSRDFYVYRDSED